MAYSVTVLQTKAAVLQGIAVSIAQNVATRSLVRLATTLVPRTPGARRTQAG
ncbi:hypothetical protein GS926_09915 [Rhodococcus hoagii]|nr:hypothetical protein [Prescottella equi]